MSLKPSHLHFKPVSLISTLLGLSCWSPYTVFNKCGYPLMHVWLGNICEAYSWTKQLTAPSVKPGQYAYTCKGISVGQPPLPSIIRPPTFTVMRWGLCFPRDSSTVQIENCLRLGITQLEFMLQYAYWDGNFEPYFVHTLSYVRG